VKFDFELDVGCDGLNAEDVGEVVDEVFGFDADNFTAGKFGDL